MRESRCVGVLLAEVCVIIVISSSEIAPNL